MGNLVNTLKKFVTNKNTVTILGILAGIIVLWIFYNYRVNKAIDPVRVPYAVKELTATSMITQEDIEWTEVSRKFLNGVKVITNINDLVGHYVNVGTSIPEGGLFYQDQVVTNKDLPDSWYSDLPKGYTTYLLSVNSKTTVGNSIYEGNYIDIYVRYVDDANNSYIGPLLEHIKVLGVLDNQNQRVFDASSSRTPAAFAFGVTQQQWNWLKAAEYLKNAEVFPVPRGKYYSEEGETLQGSETIIQYIESSSTFETSGNDTDNIIDNQTTDQTDNQ